MSQHTQELVQQMAAPTSVISAGVSWLSTANEVLQIIATIIAIVAGLMAIYPKVKAWWLSRSRASK
jgi:hypothetical protein